MKNEYKINPYELSSVEPSLWGHSMMQDLRLSFADFLPIVFADKRENRKDLLNRDAF